MMMRRKLALLLGLIAVFVAAVGARSGAAAPDPLSCQGYPEQRVFLESQSWWLQKGDETANPVGRHIHVGACFPLHQRVSGVVHLDAVLKLHGNPGTVVGLRVQVFDDYTVSKALSVSCPTDCTQVVPIDVDTTRVKDGNYEVRITANVKVNVFGKRQYQTTRWHFVVNNGVPGGGGSESRNRSPGAAGWYNGVYSNVFCGINESGFRLVTQPLLAPFTLTCKFDQDTAFATVDPDFHHGNPGTVLLNTTGGTRSVTIDPSTLAPGPHKIAVMTTDHQSDGDSTGVLVLPFTVG